MYLQEVSPDVSILVPTSSSTTPSDWVLPLAASGSDRLRILNRFLLLLIPYVVAFTRSERPFSHYLPMSLHKNFPSTTWSFILQRLRESLLIGRKLALSIPNLLLVRQLRQQSIFSQQLVHGMNCSYSIILKSRTYRIIIFINPCLGNNSIITHLEPKVASQDLNNALGVSISQMRREFPYFACR